MLPALVEDTRDAAAFIRERSLKFGNGIWKFSSVFSTLFRFFKLNAFQNDFALLLLDENLNLNDKHIKSLGDLFNLDKNGQNRGLALLKIY